MHNIKYTLAGAEDIDIIKPLWEKLIMYHRERATHFERLLESIDFEKRKAQLLKNAETGALRIDLAREADKSKIIGYCVSTINAKKQGEVESIFVEKDYRHTGIADNLMKKALQWMEDMFVERKVLVVAAGNEEVFAFYERYGFHPRGTILEQVKD